MAHRGKAKAPQHKRPEAIEATGPNELWSWDITYLPTTIKGLFFYLYLIMDVYSRKIVGWEVHDSESTDHSTLLIRKTYLREVKWTPLSRQKRVEFKMVTDQSAAEWRCPNFCFTLRFIAVNKAFLTSRYLGNLSCHLMGMW